MTQTTYRASQFVRALLAQPAAGDVRLAAQVLPPVLLPLYQGLSPAERSHAVAVLRALLRQGHTDPDLLAAALLHDVGKTRSPLHLLDRVWIVLAQRFMPTRAASWGQGPSGGWRRPFVVAAHHAMWGADLLHQQGASARLVDLVRRHHAVLPSPVPDADRLLAALQRADGSC